MFPTMSHIYGHTANSWGDLGEILCGKLRYCRYKEEKVHDGKTAIYGWIYLTDKAVVCFVFKHSADSIDSNFTINRI